MAAVSAYWAVRLETFAWRETLSASTWATFCQRRQARSTPVSPSCSANLHTNPVNFPAEQVCVQLPTLADNETLLAVTAERRAAAPCCGAAATGRPAAAVVGRYRLYSRRSAANPPHAAAARSNDRTDRRTDARPFHRPCSAYYASSVNKPTLHFIILHDTHLIFRGLYYSV